MPDIIAGYDSQVNCDTKAFCEVFADVVSELLEEEGVRILIATGQTGWNHRESLAYLNDGMTGAEMVDALSANTSEFSMTISRIDGGLIVVYSCQDYTSSWTVLPFSNPCFGMAVYSFNHDIEGYQQVGTIYKIDGYMGGCDFEAQLNLNDEYAGNGWFNDRPDDNGLLLGATVRPIVHKSGIIWVEI